MEPMKPINFEPLNRACLSLAENHGAFQITMVTGKNVKTLHNQLNTRQLTHKLGLLESAEYQLITGNFSPLRAYAAVLNHTVFPVGDLGIVSDIELLNLYSDWNKELGDVHREISKAFCDQRIERSEFNKIKHEGMEAIQKYFEFLRRLEAVIDE